MVKSTTQLDREIARLASSSSGAKAQGAREVFDGDVRVIVARRKTSDDHAIALWSDGTLTWGGIGTAIQGSPRARTEDQIREALATGWLVMGEVELYDAAEVPRLIRVARATARRGGDPGDLRRAFARPVVLRPQWTTLEADRDGRPLVRVWRLPRISHPGMAVWDEARGSRGRGRYQVMHEVGRGTGTFAPTGIQFHRLTDLDQYLRQISELTRA